MKTVDYPAVKLYLDEAERALRQGLYFSCIAVCGILSELMARELASDERSRFADVLNRLLKDGKISGKQFHRFDSIRLIRNRYVHLNLRKEIETSFMGMAREEENGNMTFLSELVYNSDDPEAEAIRLHKLCAEKDAEKMLRMLKELFSELNIPNRSSARD